MASGDIKSYHTKTEGIVLPKAAVKLIRHAREFNSRHQVYIEHMVESVPDDSTRVNLIIYSTDGDALREFDKFIASPPVEAKQPTRTRRKPWPKGGRVGKRSW